MVRHYDFQNNGRVGLIDDVASVVTDIFSFATKIFGGDEVPNYPIKSGNTYTKLVGIVNTKVPGPPTSVEHAKQLLVMAEAARKAETFGDGGAANRTIIMMYDEVIAALKQYIASGGTVYNPTANTGLPTSTTNIPYTGTPTGTSNFFTDQTILKGLPNWILLGGGAVAVYLMMRKKRRR